MKSTAVKFLSSAFVLLSIAACSGKAKNDEAGRKVSNEMQSFLSRINGSHEQVKQALKEHGLAAVQEHKMSEYNLASPVIKNAEGDSYTVSFKSGATRVKYTLHWKEGKIVKIDDDGFDFETK